jgi:hypothetical protein
MVDGSVAELAKKLYPDYNWAPWKFQSVPVSFWTDIARDNDKDDADHDDEIPTEQKKPLAQAAAAKPLPTVQFRAIPLPSTHQQQTRPVSITIQREVFDGAFRALGWSKMEDWYSFNPKGSPSRQIPQLKTGSLSKNLNHCCLPTLNLWFENSTIDIGNGVQPFPL